MLLLVIDKILCTSINLYIYMCVCISIYLEGGTDYDEP